MYNYNTVNKTIHLPYFIPYYRLYLLKHFPQIVLYGEKNQTSVLSFLYYILYNGFYSSKADSG